ncbi:MAG: methionyl-tRNA formyltransferase [Nitrososphaerales archaeon]
MTRIVFMGTPDFAVPTLARLHGDGYEVAAVYTRQDQPAGRGQRLEQSPVKKFALEQGLHVEQPRSLRPLSAQEILAAFAPDVIVVAAYGLILPQRVIDLPPYGCVNVHGSLLPRHRGAAPIAAAILAGDPEAGISIMQVDAGVDTGPVLSRASIPIAPDDTTGALTEKLARLGADLLAQTLPDWISGKIAAIPQPEDGATYAPRIEKEQGRIDWTEPAAVIERKVRAYQPWPSAFTVWNGQMLKILRSHVRDGAGEAGEEPGAVVAGGKNAAGVATGAGILWLDEVQLAGKKPAPIAAFLAGARGFIGSRLG